MLTKIKTTTDPEDKWNFGRGRAERKSIDRGGQHHGSSKMDER